ncbi:MAG TPA: glycosyltransferase family 2 protein [Bacillota bacterium]|nr:glycosyltransferase family 2 protein [Bacillota bacterium]
MLSIVIPTYNEGENVARITERITASLAGQSFEIIFVDDSTDNTPALLDKLQVQDSRVRVIHREGERGLATAVVRGFTEAAGDVLTVMDGDLQHPPELLPTLLDYIYQGYDLVIPSRFVPGGSDGGLNTWRRIVSKSARLMAWLSLRKTRVASDPMGGFFMCRRHVIQGVQLTPIGWKILLEILVKGHYQLPVEIPYQFQAREMNMSKMSIHQQLLFVQHLMRLVSGSPEDSRFWKFCLVGLSGVVVNFAVYILLVEGARLNVVLAGILSALVAMFSNFWLNDRITWKQQKGQSLYIRLAKFYIYCSLGITINALILALLHDKLGLNYLLSNLAGIIVATLWNFSANNRWTWNQPPEALAEAKIIWFSDNRHKS